MLSKSVKFTQELRLFLAAFKCFGLSPFSANKAMQMWLLLYSLFLLLIVVLLVVSAFALVKIFDEASAGTLASIVGQLVFCGLIATNVIILVQPVIFREEAAQIDDRFDTIYSLMKQKLHIEVPVQHIRVKYARKIWSIVIFLVAVTLFNILALNYYNEPLGYYLHSLWPILIIRARCIHNIFLVDLLAEFLKLLNAKLEDIIDQQTNKKKNNNRMAVKYRNTDFRHLKMSPYEELLTLKDVYGYIWDITNLINDAFGWSLLAVATQNFIEFTCNGYWLFLAMDHKTSSLSAINAICTIIPVVFVLAGISYSCYCAIDAGTTTGGLIHKLEKETTDEFHNALVREFSLQVSHEQITISANGFFNIDFSLLGSMAAATVTYLVILIQFQQTEKNKVSSA